MNEDRDHDVWVAALVQALENGSELDLAPPGEFVDPTQAKDWPTARRLPGEALRAALLKSGVTPDPQGLKIRAAYITGRTDLADLRLPYGLNFNFCAFERAADWQRLTVTHLHLTHCQAPALILDEAKIDGMLNLVGLAATEVSADRAMIGDLNLQWVALFNEGGVALHLDGANIKGGASLSHSHVTGAVRAREATIGMQLTLQNATLTAESGEALNLDGADIKGGAFLNPVTVTGEVRALGATIGRVLDLGGATLTNVGGKALSLDGADIKGSAYLNPVTATGEVRAFGATIGGQLVLEGAALTNEGGKALSLDWADIKSSASLSRLAAIGEVRGLEATISGQLDLEGATLSNNDGAALALRSARLGYVKLAPTAVMGAIRLDAAQIAILVAPDDMTVLTGSELSASGWRLGDVRGGIRHDRKAAADWLSNHNGQEFVPQPWHELANLYERNGQPADARWMRRKAAQGVTRTSPWWLKPIRWLYGGLTGHGYSPLRAAGWLVLAIVFSGIIVTANAAVFTPTATNKATWKTPPAIGQPAPSITGATPCAELQDRASCLNPVLYAFDNALPGTLATGQAAQWTGQRRPRPQCLGPLRPWLPQDRQLDLRRAPARRCHRTSP